MKYKVNTLATQDFSALTASTQNIYQSVAIISKRSRQVASYIKEELDNKLADFITEEDVEEIQDEEKASQQEQAIITQAYEKLPKPVNIAIEEFLTDKLMYRYSEEEATPPPVH